MEQVRPRYYYAGDFAAYEPLLRRYPHQETTFPKGAFLSGSGAYFHAHFFILSGAIATNYLHCSGNEKQMFIHGPGIIWPLCIPVHFEQERNMRIHTLTETRCLVFDNETLCRIMNEHIELFPVMMNLSRNRKAVQLPLLPVPGFSRQQAGPGGLPHLYHPGHPAGHHRAQQDQHPQVPLHAEEKRDPLHAAGGDHRP